MVCCKTAPSKETEFFVSLDWWRLMVPGYSPFLSGDELGVLRVYDTECPTFKYF